MIKIFPWKIDLEKGSSVDTMGLKASLKNCKLKILIE